MSSNEKNKKVNLLTPISIVSLILVLLATIVVGIWGFNAGLDFKGGTQLVVQFETSNIDITNEEDYQKASKGVREILNNNDIKINSFQAQGEYNTKYFVITFDKTTDKTLQDIRLQINQKFNTSQAFNELKEQNKEVEIVGAQMDLTRRTSNIDSFIVMHSYLATVSALLFVLALITFYACFRFKGAGAISLLLCGLFDVLMTLTFIALSRIEVNAYIFALVALVLAVSIYCSSSFFFELKEIAKEPKYSEKSNKELAIFVLKRNWTKNLILYISAFVLSLLLTFLGTGSLIHVALASFAGLAVVFASHTFVMPEFWALICKDKINSTKSSFLRVAKDNKQDENKPVNTKSIPTEEEEFDDEEENNIEEKNEEQDDVEVEIIEEDENK